MKFYKSIVRINDLYYTIPQYTIILKGREKMAHTIADKKKLLARVRRIKGQSEALESSLETETECMSVLQQIAAIKGAVNGLMKQVLEGHLREHLGAEGITPEQRKDEIEKVILILKSYLK